MTTTVTPAASRTARWSSPLALGAVLALVVAATALAATSAPVPQPVRALGALTLVLVAGHCAGTLVLGRRRPRRGPRPSPRPAPRPGPRPPARPGPADDPDAVPRATLPVVFGLLALLAAMLLLPASRPALTAPNVAVVLGGLTLLLVLGRGIVVPVRLRPVHRPQLRRLLRGGSALAAAVVVLGLAVAGAVAVQPVVVERYPVITLDDPLLRTGDPLVSRPAAAVDVGVTLAGHGVALGPGGGPVEVRIGGAPVEAAVSGPLPPLADPLSGETDRQRRAVRFTAPTQAGLYPVQITAAPPPGTSDPLTLVVLLQVAP